MPKISPNGNIDKWVAVDQGEKMRSTLEQIRGAFPSWMFRFIVCHDSGAKVFNHFNKSQFKDSRESPITKVKI